MMKVIKFLVPVLLLIFLATSCEEDSSPAVDLPLNGLYVLNAMTISVQASIPRDTTITFIEAQNGGMTTTLSASTPVFSSIAAYSDQDSIPISGTIELKNNGTATLHGFLPVNFGSGCHPLVLIWELGSDGYWSADTSSGTFSVDLIEDALDIDGSFTLNGDQLEIRYESVVDVDERSVSSVTIDGSEIAIVPGCFSVTTVTERVMTLTVTE